MCLLTFLNKTRYFKGRKAWLGCPRNANWKGRLLNLQNGKPVIKWCKKEIPETDLKWIKEEDRHSITKQSYLLIRRTKKNQTVGLASNEAMTAWRHVHVGLRVGKTLKSYRKHKNLYFVYKVEKDSNNGWKLIILV